MKELLDSDMRSCLTLDPLLGKLWDIQRSAAISFHSIYADVSDTRFHISHFRLSMR